MRVGAILSPVAEWEPIVEAAKVADELSLDAIGLWDHYHSPRPEWGYVSGWAAYGALAAATTRVRLVPMVLNNLHYQPGVLAKESSVLAIASGGRFELGIGAGDWPESFAAWGEDFPSGEARLERLEETVTALRRLWSGQAIDFAGRHVRLDHAISTPAPMVPPRVVVGVGGSRRSLRSAVRYADELNLYAEPDLLDDAAAVRTEAARDMALSVFVDWSWDKWPGDAGAELAALADRGIDRVLVSIGADDMQERIRQVAAGSGGGR